MTLLLAEMGAPLMFISQAIAFLILVAVLLKFVKPVLRKILTERTKGIEDTFAKIERDTAETRSQIRDLEAKLGDIDREAQRRLKAALEEANVARSRAISDANAAASAELEKARREIDIERQKAILELRQETTRLTLEAAQYLVRVTMNDPLHEGMVEKYLAKLDTVKKT